jgi:hypothetical protein
VAVLGTLHDYPLAVPDGWTPRILPDTPGFPLAVYERIADGAPTDIAFTLTSNDATTVALFEFTGPAVSDAHAQNSTGRRLSDASTSVSTGTAENTTGTIAIAVIHRPDEKAERVETIDDWTNGFVEIVDFGCGLRSRTAVAIRAVSAGPVETTASWTTPRQARGAIVTYANALP